MNPMNQTQPRISDFWEARGRGGFWIAEQAGYRVGAVLAWILTRLGLTPNFVSLLSLTAGAGCLFLGARAGPGTFAGGAWVLGGLFLSYWLDCADGQIARVTRKGSTFGSVLDKISDMALALLIVGVLGLAALGQPNRLIGQNWPSAIFLLSLLTKPLLNVLSWLKDSQTKQMDHTLVAQKPRSFFGWAKRFVGNAFDDAPYRFGVGLSWGLGFYWEFALAFHAVFAVLILGYTLSSWRDLARYDAANRVLSP